MSLKNRKAPHGFTLLELVVVLAILAVVTALATRSLGTLEDQRRFESSQRGLDELQAAVIGSDDDRAPDGTRIVSGFVADLSRLPRTVVDPGLTPAQFTLRELWTPTGVPYDVRAATSLNGVVDPDQDPQVFVAGGWRGPYLRLPLGANNLLDGWGNGYSSPTAPVTGDAAFTTGYARLRDASNNAITTAGQDIAIVEHLGANGRQDDADTGYDRDAGVIFISATEDHVHATLTGNVEVLDGEGRPVTPSASKIIVRVFAPNPENPAQIVVYKTQVDFTANPVAYTIVAPTLTIGARVVRAYLGPDGATPATATERSGVNRVILRPGVNVQDLKIDR